MLKNLLIVLIAFCQLSSVNAQSDRVYSWDWKKDGIVLGVSGAFFGGSVVLLKGLEKSTLEEIELLDRNNVWAFDRGATNNYSPSAGKLSDYFLYGGMAFTMANYVHKKGRNEGFAIFGMFLESYFIIDGITVFIKGTAKRYRPLVYNPNAPIEERLSTSARLSFPSGHTSVSAMSTFFAAKIYSDLHPNSKWKPLVWGLAAVIPATTGYLRYKAGKHFPTDVITGYALGAAVGYLIPHFHKVSNEKVSYELIPVPQGLVFSYHRKF